jgi:hypothetical protein
MNNENEVSVKQNNLENSEITETKQNITKNQPNKELFREIIRGTNLSEEEIKKNFPNLDKDWKNDTVEPVKTATDEEKIKAYDSLKVGELPEDWKVQLLRLKYLEGELSNYEKTREELKGWTETFTDKNPLGVSEEIKQLGESKEKTEKELNEKVAELESDLVKVKREKVEITAELEQKNRELEEELAEWKGFFQKELEQVKEEWQSLSERPDIEISEDDFYDDYAKRKSAQHSKSKEKEIEFLKEKVKEYKEKNNKLFQKIENYLEKGRDEKFILAKPVSTINQANEAIVWLLKQEEKELEDYFKGGKINGVLPLELEVYPDKEAWVKQVLEWIKETRTTLDYEKLAERWSGGSDFDGNLKVLKKYLEVLKGETKEAVMAV